MNESSPILLVEDSENDIILFRYAYSRAGVPNPLQIVMDGQKALDYLEGRGPFTDRAAFALPCLVLLDLRMPKIPGLEVLKAIRANPSFNYLRVIVLSSSDQNSDREQAQTLGANGYVTKPSHPEDLVCFLKTLV